MARHLQMYNWLCVQDFDLAKHFLMYNWLSGRDFDYGQAFSDVQLA